LLAQSSVSPAVLVILVNLVYQGTEKEGRGHKSEGTAKNRVEERGFPPPAS